MPTFDVVSELGNDDTRRAALGGQHATPNHGLRRCLPLSDKGFW